MSLGRDFPQDLKFRNMQRHNVIMRQHMYACIKLIHDNGSATIMIRKKLRFQVIP